MASITHSFHIDSSAVNIYAAISRIEGLKKWWTYDVTGGEFVGQKLLFKFGGNGFIEFEIVSLNENNKTHWKCTNAHPEWLGTEAVFELLESNGKTKINFTHSNWQEQTEYFAHCNFSWAKYFISLRNYCENGIGQPYKE